MKTITTAKKIGQEFRKLEAEIDIYPYCKVFYSTPQHNGSPHTEKVGNDFCFVVTKRGSKFERVGTTDPDEIPYLLPDGVTQVAATAYELRNRVDGIDGREVWFPYQEQLLHDLKPVGYAEEVGAPTDSTQVSIPKLSRDIRHNGRSSEVMVAKK